VVTRTGSIEHRFKGLAVVVAGHCAHELEADDVYW
jgi:hypothetical protein